MRATARSRLDVTLRPRRQITLPAEVCEALGIEVGDRLELSVADQRLVITPRKATALAALREIQRAFSQSGVTEKDLQAEGRWVREKLSHSRHG